jgi:hypothetical protein
MSVNTWYRCITPALLEQLVEEARHDPDAPANYLHPENEGEDYERPEPGLWTARNWYGLHSLLTFGKWAEQPLLGEAIAGGTPIGWDYCYADSPVRYFTATQVRDIAPVLQAVQEDALRDSCDPVALNAADVPPGGWQEGDFVYLWETYSNIRDFFRTAQEQGYAVLVYLC